MEKNAYQRYYTKPSFQFRTYPIYSSQQRYIQFYLKSHYMIQITTNIIISPSVIQITDQRKMKSLDHIAWFKRHIEKNAYQRYYATPYFKSGHARLTLHNRDMSNPISNHIQITTNTISPPVIQITDQRKMNSLDRITWFKRHIEKHVYQRYYTNTAFQFRTCPTYSSQQRIVHLHHILHYINKPPQPTYHLTLYTNA
jgi:hypothetical protein